MRRIDGNSKRRLGWTLTLLVAALPGTAAQPDVPASTATPAQQPQPVQEKTEPKRRIVVSIPDRKLALIEDGKVTKVYEVAVGAEHTPSPAGSYTIVKRSKGPSWTHKGVVMPAGKNNPIGPRWIGLSKKGYGIHGTNAPRSIGKAASHGCVRMHNEDVVDLFERVQVGDVVEIKGDRDEEVAQIFGTNDTQVAQTTTTVAGQ